MRPRLKCRCEKDVPCLGSVDSSQPSHFKRWAVLTLMLRERFFLTVYIWNRNPGEMCAMKLYKDPILFFSGRREIKCGIQD
jgi:hypothetical protein